MASVRQSKLAKRKCKGFTALGFGNITPPLSFSNAGVNFNLVILLSYVSNVDLTPFYVSHKFRVGFDFAFVRFAGFASSAMDGGEAAEKASITIYI